MRSLLELAAAFTAIKLANAVPLVLPRGGGDEWQHTNLEQPTPETDYYISYGPRPYFILQNMTEGPLKSKLESCQNGPFEITAWSIGHRGGGTLMIPEETVQSTEAGARMGAGVLECDVSFTSDRGLVCRHDLCDLATTTDILLRPELAAKCTVPFTPANDTVDASVTCCTSDITLEEFTTLCGKMDGFNASATAPEYYKLGGIPPWRTELYDTCGTVMTLESYIDLVDSLPGYRNFTPELKTPPKAVPMPFNGYTQEQYGRDMLNTFLRKGINPQRVWPQSFLPADIYQWLAEYPDTFGPQAVFLDEDGDTPDTFITATARLPSLKAKGVNIIAPPFNYLITVGGEDNATLVPSAYATTAIAAGLSIISWSFERSGPLADVVADEDYYYTYETNLTNPIHYDGQEFDVLNVLASIPVTAMFSDWSSTVGYFANCFGLTGPVGEDYS